MDVVELARADGSVDLYFGPKAPAGKEANWTQTVPGKGWFTRSGALRRYLEMAHRQPMS